MESVNRTIWDEWGAMPSNEQARDEAAGILDGLPSRARGEEIMFISPRLFAVREYLGRTFIQTKNRPSYLIEEEQRPKER